MLFRLPSSLERPVMVSFSPGVYAPSFTLRVMLLMARNLLWHMSRPHLTTILLEYTYVPRRVSGAHLVSTRPDLFRHQQLLQVTTTSVKANSMQSAQCSSPLVTTRFSTGFLSFPLHLEDFSKPSRTFPVPISKSVCAQTSTQAFGPLDAETVASVLQALFVHVDVGL